MDFFEQRKMQCLSRMDKSRQGQVDKDIKPLVRLINSLPNFYTTSSCAGRILILAVGKRKCDCRRIFITHRKTTADEVISHLSGLPEDPCWFRQESFIIHVCSRDLASAIELLRVARESGFKHSGIISVGNRIMVEIGSNEGMDVPVSDDGILLVENRYLSYLAKVANKKMDQNSRRLKKFKEKIKASLSPE